MAMSKQVELLAPAGNWECIEAAVSNGADAVYFGLDQFNARLRADNFTREDLPVLMGALHERGVRGYVTMNTLVFTREMEEACQWLLSLDAAGVDGVIIQDIGLAWILSRWKREHPEILIELHSSTQMTLTSPEAIHFMERFLSWDQIVLARELSLQEIEDCAKSSPTPIEVFVHGALCVSYSGQCLTSESLGLRSANRGECAQACRLPYSLVVNGRVKHMGDRRYLLSPQDLCALDDIPELVRRGVKSLKIEGRLKSPAYVAAATVAYRKALDAALAGVSVDSCVTEDDRYAMQMAFSRGFSHGWLHGPDHPRLTPGRFGKKRGVFVGQILRVGPGWVEVDLAASVPLAPGDGFVFDSGEDRNEEQGGRIWKIQGNRLFFHGKASRIDWNRVLPGQGLWKTDDPTLNRRLKQTWGHRFRDSAQMPVVPLVLHCIGKLGEPLVILCPEYGMEVRSDIVLTKAVKHPLSLKELQKQLGRLGGTGFFLQSCTADIPQDVMLPVSSLNRARRNLVERLQSLPQSPQKRSITCVLPVLKEGPSREQHEDIQLSVLCRTPQQLTPCIQEGISFLYLDFEELRDYKGALEYLRAQAPDTNVFLATPRIQKPREVGFFKMIERLNPDGILVRNPGGAQYFHDSSLRLIADFSWNIANPWTAAVLKEQGRFERLTISYDLNIDQVLDLLSLSQASWFELTLHQHIPMFHMEHCVFCSFLSRGGHNYKDCGRPCEHYQVQLQDRLGVRHPLHADAGCRNTVFNGRAQTGASFLPQLQAAGLSRFRIELLDHSPQQTQSLLRAYKDLLAGKTSAANLVSSLNLLEQLGATAGTLATK